MILLGVTASIAAYKAIEVLRLLVKEGEEVHVMMTPSATRFVGPLTFQALSGQSVLVDILDPQGWQMAHLELVERASAVLVAPASAETLSLLARGGAADLISASLLAAPRDSSGKLQHPILLAPAMHESMWLHPATQANVTALRGFGYEFIGPVEGALGRVGDEGQGRMVDPKQLATKVLSYARTQKLQ